MEDVTSQVTCPDDVVTRNGHSRRKRSKPKSSLNATCVDESSRDSDVNEPSDLTTEQQCSDAASSTETTERQTATIDDSPPATTGTDSNKVCEICRYETADDDKYTTHVNFHQVALKCWYCHAVFAAAEFLKKHVEQCVNRGRIRDCSYCGQQFTERESLLAHEFYAHHMSLKGGPSRKSLPSLSDERQLYRCPVCFEKVTSFTQYQLHLDAHLKASVSDESLECKLCRLTFVNDLAIQNHISSSRHRELSIRVKNLFRCHHCNTIYISRDSYAMHMLEIAREESHNALAQMGIQNSLDQSALLLWPPTTTQDAVGTDSENSNDRNSLADVVKKGVVIKAEKFDDQDEDEEGRGNQVEKYVTECQQMEEATSDDDESKFDPHTPLLNINKSIEAVNLTLSETRARAVGEFSSYRCSVCSRRLPDQDQFAMHMLQHARETSQSQSAPKSSNSDLINPVVKSEPIDHVIYENSSSIAAYTVKCSICNLNFPSRDGLAMHVMLDHSTHSATTGTGTNYTTLENLINSLYHDTNATSSVRQVNDIYSCPVCKITLKDQDALAMHMLLHSHLPVNSGASSMTSRNVASSSAASSAASSAMQDWQRSILLALYKDQSNVSAGDRLLGNSGVETEVRRRRSLADSEVTSSDASLMTQRENTSDTGELFDGNIIVYDRCSETWACTVCKVEFRTLLYVTRHLGHVSHKLQVEKRLRLEMCSNSNSKDKSPDNFSLKRNRSSFDSSSGRSDPKFDNSTKQSPVFNCNKCHALFQSKTTYYNHFLNNEHCRPADFGDISPSKRLRVDEATFLNPYPWNRQNSGLNRYQPEISGHNRYQPDFSGHNRHQPDLTGHNRYQPDLSGHNRHQPDLSGHNRYQPDIVGRRRSSTQSAPCVSESEPRVEIASPLSVRSIRRASNNNTASFLNASSFRHSIETSSTLETEDIKSRPVSSAPQSDSTTDVLDFVLKQPILLMCKFCQMIFCDRTLYYLHMGLHNLNNPWQCNLCGKACKGVHEFSSHVIHYN